MSDSEPEHHRHQYTLRGLLAGTTLIAVSLGMFQYRGLAGIAIIYNAWLVGVVVLKCLRVRQIAGFTVPTLTVLEWATIVLIGYILNKHPLGWP